MGARIREWLVRGRARRSSRAAKPPTGVHNLPAPSAVFVGRDLDQLRHAFTDGIGVISQASTVPGLGGVGKSALALHYAHAHARRYPLRWWITADSPDNVTLGLTDLTQRLHPDERQPLTLVDGRRRAMTYLRNHHGWLLVLDNVNEIEHVADLCEQLRGKGHILITTHRDLSHAIPAHRGLAPIRLGVLARPASLQLLAQLLGTRYQPEPADRLAAELGDLPLALRQAAAFISQDRTLNIDGYLRLLAQHPADGATAADTPQGRAVARVVDLTVDRITDEDPLARRILDVLAYFAPDQLPETVLAPLADEVSLANALALLASYAMTTRSDGHISVHRFVQTVTRDRHPKPEEPGQVPEPLTVAINLLTQAAPGDLLMTNGWPAWQRLLAHVDTATSHLPRNHTNPEALGLLGREAVFRQYQGQLDQAIALFEATLPEMLRLLGPDHPETLALRAELACAYDSAERMDDAISQLEITLAGRERVLGPAHPDTLSSRTNLAYAYQSVQRMDEAIALYEANVAEVLRVSGPGHRDTRSARNVLAYAYGSAGRLDDSISQLEVALAETLQAFGPDHPDTLTARSDLAEAYQLAGRLDEAISQLQVILAARERVPGPRDPRTMSVREYLGRLLTWAGRFDEAISLHQAAVAEMVRLCGPDHPYTLSARKHLAGTLASAGRLDEAISLYEATLAGRERVLGRDDPSTLDIRYDLADALASAGRLDEALSQFEAILAFRKRRFGPDSQSTLLTRNHLAGALARAGRLDKAISLYKATLPEMVRVFGPDHPSTLTARNDLARTLMSARRLDEAISLYEATLADAERALGPNHPLTQTVSGDLRAAQDARRGSAPGTHRHE